MSQIFSICLFHMGIWLIIFSIGAYFGFDHAGTDKKTKIGKIIMIFSLVVFLAAPLLISMMIDFS